jgi:glycosyltransferase involved in cell wall biosynthesis
VPLVSVLVAVHDDARYVGAAIDSMLGQTLDDFELVVVDDASTDGTAELLAAVADARLVLLRNDEQLGLAASLNRGLERATGRYVARLDADDVALPRRLELQVARIRSRPAVAILGSDIADLDEKGRPGRVHEMPRGAAAVRWHALFAAPFFHPTVLVDREVLDEHGLRYDASYLESEDYDLWTRLLAHVDGDNLARPLVLKRAHPGQASKRRRDLQTSFQREVALRQIARLAPDLSAEEAELAWGLGSGRNRSRAAAAPYLSLLERFEAVHGVDAAVRDEAARALARAGAAAPALRLSPSLPLRVPAARIRRRRAAHDLRRADRRPEARPTRVTVVSPEPTPYRAPLFDRIGERPEVDLTVVYAAPTVAGRTWSVEPRHRAVFLKGLRLPGVRRLFRHEYPVTPGIQAALREADPDVVVVSGWSTFASQAAVAWCRAKRIPYVLLVESHDVGPRPSWRRAIKGAVVPRLLRRAAGLLVVGSAARKSVVERGADPHRVRLFANTIDVHAWEERADALSERRRELRERLGAGDEDVLVLSVGRLAPEKGFGTLLRAVAAADGADVAVAVAGAGPEHETLERLAAQLGVRVRLLGDLAEERLAEAYAAADVFALLSTQEPWAVVVNEAAATGLPLVLSDRVGAAYDLLRDGENGFLVPAGDVRAAAEALRRLAGDPDLRARAGARSRELVRDWGYERSVEEFVAAVRDPVVRPVVATTAR